MSEANRRFCGVVPSPLFAALMAGYDCLEVSMVLYRRMFRVGGTYFFTLNLLERRGNDLLIRYIDVLREAVRVVKARYPFVIHAWVVLPEHTHFVIELPEGDCDYSLRIRLIKAYFSRHLPKDEMRNLARQRRHERGIWQRRFWEHLIRDERDLSSMWIMCISILSNMAGWRV